MMLGVVTFLVLVGFIHLGEANSCFPIRMEPTPDGSPRTHCEVNDDIIPVGHGNEKNCVHCHCRPDMAFCCTIRNLLNKPVPEGCKRKFLPEKCSEVFVRIEDESVPCEL